MKLNKILSLAKEAKRIEIVGTPQAQWVKIPGAAYPLSGFPRLRTREEVLTMFGVTPKEFEEWDVSFDEDRFGGQYSLERTEADDEAAISAESFGLIIGGEPYLVYCTPEGAALISRAFFLPPERVRGVSDCGGSVRLWDGMLCVGVVEKHVLTEDELIEIGRLRKVLNAETARENIIMMEGE